MISNLGQTGGFHFFRIMFLSTNHVAAGGDPYTLDSSTRIWLACSPTEKNGGERFQLITTSIETHLSNFSVAAPSLWNSLPNHTRPANTLPPLKPFKYCGDTVRRDPRLHPDEIWTFKKRRDSMNI